MSIKSIVVAAASLLAFVSQPSEAQTLILPGSLLLAGYRATCGPVDTMIQPIDDIAAAYKGRIILHPRLLNLPRAQQLFWYTHECAHQIFGPGEAAADCWAIQQGKIQGWLSSTEFNRLSQSMYDFPGDATHADGMSRVKHMQICYAR